MNLKLVGLTGLAAAAVLAGPALARGDFDNLFFMRSQATASGFFKDRASCSSEASHMGDNDAAYSNPQYGALSAMGSALDEDALHEGGLHDRMRRAVFTDCMKRLGWVPADLTDSETHELMRASLSHPEPLEAWLKAHQPPPEPPAAAPAAQTVKTAATGPAAPSSQATGSTTVRSAN